MLRSLLSSCSVFLWSHPGHQSVLASVSPRLRRGLSREVGRERSRSPADVLETSRTSSSTADAAGSAGPALVIWTIGGAAFGDRIPYAHWKDRTVADLINKVERGEWEPSSGAAYQQDEFFGSSFGSSRTQLVTAGLPAVQLDAGTNGQQKLADQLRAHLMPAPLVSVYSSPTSTSPAAQQDTRDIHLTLITATRQKPYFAMLLRKAFSIAEEVQMQPNRQSLIDTLETDMKGHMMNFWRPPHVEELQGGRGQQVPDEKRAPSVKEQFLAFITSVTGGSRSPELTAFLDRHGNELAWLLAQMDTALRTMRMPARPGDVLVEDEYAFKRSMEDARLTYAYRDKRPCRPGARHLQYVSLYHTTMLDGEPIRIWIHLVRKGASEAVQVDAETEDSLPVAVPESIAAIQPGTGAHLFTQLFESEVNLGEDALGVPLIMRIVGQIHGATFANLPSLSFAIDFFTRPPPAPRAE
ncbi:unnamed protein product [Amoebophrya sp. A120]|nr:unnamed protein product [Amoebophrya sp. A120]|eukprot:GSA120T00015444001.1